MMNFATDYGCMMYKFQILYGQNLQSTPQTQTDFYKCLKILVFGRKNNNWLMEKYPSIEFGQAAKRFGMYWKQIPYWASEVRDFFSTAILHVYERVWRSDRFEITIQIKNTVLSVLSVI